MVYSPTRPPAQSKQRRDGGALEAGAAVAKQPRGGHLLRRRAHNVGGERSIAASPSRGGVSPNCVAPPYGPPAHARQSPLFRREEIGLCVGCCDFVLGLLRFQSYFVFPCSSCHAKKHVPRAASSALMHAYARPNTRLVSRLARSALFLRFFGPPRLPSV